MISDRDVIVRTADAVLIPPRSEALIPVLLPLHFGAGLSIIEPSIKLHILQLALAKSIVSPIWNRTVCKIMNPTNVAKFVKRKTIAVTQLKLADMFHSVHVSDKLSTDSRQCCCIDFMLGSFSGNCF